MHSINSKFLVTPEVLIVNITAEPADIFDWMDLRTINKINDEVASKAPKYTLSDFIEKEDLTNMFHDDYR